METKFHMEHSFEAWRFSRIASRLQAIGNQWMHRWPTVTVVVTTKPKGIYATVTVKVFADRPEHVTDVFTYALRSGMPLA
jgi:hypothetical protein